ncbi:hypothetical protein ACFV9W_31785 [Streptomyces sp. NPDC059897]|uniref:hypothetical protein n=1 Tax=Streptomyces sp. NPDC059897 TaxID=3346994 RepID=UPI00364CF338
MTHGSEFDEELRSRFRGQGRPGLTMDRPRAARQARRVSAGISALIAFVAIALTGIRLGQGSAPGPWTALYLAGGVISGFGVLLARLGRTRCAFAAICVGAGVAIVGDGPMFG